MGYLDNGVLYNNAGQKVSNSWLNRKIYLGKKGSNGTSSGIEAFFDNIFSGLGSWFRGKTGQGLTGAELEANQFNADEAEKQRQFELEMANTANQRQVADLQAAGINPLMAVSKGVQLPSASSATSVSPGAGTFQLSELLNLYRMKQLLPLEKEAAKAGIDKTKAETGKIGSETTGIDILNNYRAVSEELRLEGQTLANELSKANRQAVYAGIDKIQKDIEFIGRQSDTELVKQAALRADTLLKDCTSAQIVELLPYEKAYKAASTHQAKQAAALAAANAAYQNRLIDDGYIEAVVRSAYKESALKGVQLDSAQLNYEVQQIRSSFRTGKLPESMDSGVNRVVMDYFLQPLELLLDNFNPLSGVLSSSAAAAK